MKPTVIFAFAGPSGSGKSRLLDGLLELFPEQCTKWQQFTTRPRRPGEGATQYVFVNDAQYGGLRPMLTCKTEFAGNRYGTLPEAGTEGKVVLTIADAAGLKDLCDDIVAHNKGVSGKFGAAKVKLVKVLFMYDLSEQTVAERGRASRGVGFVQDEALKLNDLMASESQLYAGLGEHALYADVGTTVTVSTAGSRWPDPAEFFASHIAPAINASSRGPAREAAMALHGFLLTDAASEAFCAKALGAIDDLLDEGRSAASYSPPAGPADEIDSALSDEPLPPAAGQAPAEPPPEAPEPAQAPVSEDAPPADAPSGEPPAPEEPSDGPVPHGDEIDRMIAEMRERAAKGLPVVPAAPEAPKAAAPAAAEAPANERGPRFLSLRDLVNSVGFESWVLTNGLKDGPFRGEAQFKETMERYMTANRTRIRVPITYAYSKREDPHNKGGHIKRFACIAGSERFVVDYSTTLRRPISVGMQQDPA